MRLIGWELYKILKRRITKVVLAIALLWILANMIPMGFANYGFGTDVTAPSWQANRLIASSYEWAKPWQGPLTTEKLLQARQQALETQQAYLSEKTVYEENGAGAWSVVESLAYIWINAGYIDGGNFCSAFETIPEEAFYQVESIRKSLVQEQIAHYAAPEREYLQKLEAQVKMPFQYDWYQGQWRVLDYMDDTMFLVGVLICIALVPVFNEEIRTGSCRVTHCTKYGRFPMGSAKGIAALLFAGIAFLVAMGIIVTIQLFYFGTRGLQCSLQLVMYQSVLPITLGQMELALVLFGLFSCMAAAAVTIFFSAWFDNSFPAGILMFSVLVLLRIVAMRLGGSGLIGLLAQLVPFQTQVSEFGQVRAVTVAGWTVWRPVFRLLLNAGTMAILCPLAVWRYTTRWVV